MTDRETEVFINISEQLGKLNANMESVLGQLAQHNTRITNLEQNNVRYGKDDFRTEMLKMMTKCLIIALVTISSLAGCSGIIVKIFGI